MTTNEQRGHDDHTTTAHAATNGSEVDTVEPEASQATEDMKKSPPKAGTTDNQEQLRESNDKLLRLRAEFDNFRKRSQRDIADARKLAKMGTIEEILPIMDQFQMAMSAANSSDDLGTLKQGMNLILTEFDRRFNNLGLERIATNDLAFDHNAHEAISTEPSTTIPEGHIIREWKAGYRFGERLLRPAGVVVSSGPPAGGESTDEQNELPRKP